MKGKRTPYAVVDGVIFNTRSQLRKYRKENPNKSFVGVEYRHEKEYRKNTTEKSPYKKIRRKRRTAIYDIFTEEGIQRLKNRLKGFEEKKVNKNKSTWITIHGWFKKYKDTDITKPMIEEIAFKSSTTFILKDFYKYFVGYKNDKGEEVKGYKTPQEVLDGFYILLPGEILKFEKDDEDDEDFVVPTATIFIQDPPIFTSEFPK